MKKPLFVGIDLGTTNSAAAVFDGEQVTLIRNSTGSTLLPSAIRLDAKGNMSIGAKARKALENDPDNVKVEFKRLMGTKEQLSFPSSKKTMTPVELSAEILKSLRADIQEQYGVAPERAVISVPALFELPQNSATSEAARLAGFEKVELIQEPIASALAAGWSKEASEGSWLVYDLGGGTFDASLLETRDGLLRVVGHDGDNFLGGRDFDLCVIDEVLARVSKESGVEINRSDARLARGLRKLKLMCEEAKIDLTRAKETSITFPGAFELDGTTIDIDVTLTRAELEQRWAALVDRSILVTARLLGKHGLSPDQLTRMVLVGGPTVIPFLRARLTAVLGIPFAEGHDPMTLVAQGAALYAANLSLDGRPKAATQEAGRRVWLQYPTMTSDLSPHVVGRLVEEPGTAPHSIHFVREKDGKKSPESTFNEEGAFVVAVELLPRQQTDFEVVGLSKDGQRVPLKPSRISIIHGMTLSDPPLSRAIGIATADNRVQTYFARGAPLPARRTFRLTTVEPVIKGMRESTLRIPIVQGEYESAHLCRLVGMLEVRGDKIQNTLPLGTTLELALDVDRGGRMSARAQIVSTGEVFEEVAALGMPDASVATLLSQYDKLSGRLDEMIANATKLRNTDAIKALERTEQSLVRVETDIAAARGGDADSAQKAFRALIEVDSEMEDADALLKWPLLEAEVDDVIASTNYWLSQNGTPQERKMFDDSLAAIEKARAGKQKEELRRRLGQLRNLRSASYYRHPDAWLWNFEGAASMVDDASDLPRAKKLVSEGWQAVEAKQTERLKSITQQLWKLLPADAEERRLGHNSSVR